MTPPFGITKLPAGENRALRGPELQSDKLVALIEANGARLAWSRACACTCVSFNVQSQQPDPLCTVCQGAGTRYFGPRNYTPPVEVGSLTPLQQTILDSGAAVIRGVVQKATQDGSFYDILGNWVRGTMLVSVRPENIIGYYDRLVNLDSVVTYNEVLVRGTSRTGAALAATDPVVLRYPAVDVNVVFTLTARYEYDTDFVLQNGALVWRAGRGPSTGTRYAVHYLMHPTWLVIEHPHVLRVVQRRARKMTPVDPYGKSVDLPIQAAVRLEFLPPQVAT